MPPKDLFYEHLTSPCHDVACGGLRGEGKESFSIRKLWTTLIFFDFTKTFVGTLFLGGEWLKNFRPIFLPFQVKKCKKTQFRSIFSHFMQFWSTLIFLIFDWIFFGTVFFSGGGGTPKFIFNIFHLVRSI